MRWKILILLWLVLVAGTVGLWSLRFEQVQHLPGWNLADLRQNSSDLPGFEWIGEGEAVVLRVWRGSGGRSNSVVMPLPGAVGVEGLHLRHRFRATGLVPGRRPWEDGRVMVEWHPPDGVGEPEREYFASVRHGQEVRHPGVVMRPLKAPAVPMLRFQHLGQAGYYDISELVVRPVRERSLWVWGRWGLAVLWCGWWYALVGLAFGGSGWRGGLSALVWVGCAAMLAVPGPWKIHRPLGLSFKIGAAPPHQPPAERGSPAGGALVDRASPGAVPSRAGTGDGMTREPRARDSSVHHAKVVPAVGKVPVQGSLVLRIREWTRDVRPLLHAWMLAAPAMVFAWMLGKRAAWCLSLTLAMASELAQYGYGYGFGPDDLVDLGFDALGVWCGVLVSGWLAARLARLNPSHALAR